MPSFVLTRLDLGPDALASVLPLRATVVRSMPGSDRPDYLLCRPASVIAGVRFLVICTRFVGQVFSVGMHDLAVNIAYVIDESLIEDDSVDFGKLEFAAVGFIDDSPDVPSSVERSE